MPVVIPSGYAQFTLNYNLTGAATGRAATVLGFGGSGDISTTADAFADQIGAAYQATIGQEMSVLCTLDTIYWATATQSGVVPGDVPGVRTGDLEMVNTCFLASYSSGFKGPRARGRSYWPGLINSSDTADAATISSGRMTTLTTQFEAFFDSLEGDGFEDSQQVILQRNEPGQVSPPISPPPPVVRRTYSNRPATQRRRLRR